MVVTPAQARAIMDGRKTQHRRPLATWTAPKVGASIPVRPGHRELAVCRVRITATWQQRLSELTPPAARAEGHRTLTRFKEEWLTIHDAAWIAAHNDAGPEERRARFHRRWAHVLVLAVAFCVDEDTPRFMARPAGNTGDYATSASAPRVIDRLEVVDSMTQDRITKLARETNGEPANPRIRARRKYRDEHIRRMRDSEAP